MAGVFKAVAAGYQPVSAAVGSVVIDNTVNVKLPATEIQTDDETDAEGAATEKQDAADSEAARAKTEEEIEQLKQFYKIQGEKALADAKSRAENILRDTEKQAAEYALQAKKQADEMFRKAQEDGFAQGQEEGYKKGLMKCKDMLLELKAVSERINTEKEELFADYETEIFDTVLEIVNRVTVNTLTQKDKTVIRKTIKEAGKAFRNSDYVKLTLSGADITEEMAADADFFRKLFTNVRTVEVEVLKDAPSGTVILDNGSETIDAGIQTQLKMIEELGRGKYRRTPSRRKKKDAADAGIPAASDNDGTAVSDAPQPQNAAAAEDDGAADAAESVSDEI